MAARKATKKTPRRKSPQKQGEPLLGTMRELAHALDLSLDRTRKPDQEGRLERVGYNQ